MSSHAKIAMSIKASHRQPEIASNPLDLNRIFFAEHELDATNPCLSGLLAHIKIKRGVFLEGITAADLVGDPDGYKARSLRCPCPETQPKTALDRTQLQIAAGLEFDDTLISGALILFIGLVFSWLFSVRNRFKGPEPYSHIFSSAGPRQWAFQTQDPRSHNYLDTQESTIIRGKIEWRLTRTCWEW
jgi:hypothetical protein